MAMQYMEHTINMSTRARRNSNVYITIQKIMYADDLHDYQNHEMDKEDITYTTHPRNIDNVEAVANSTNLTVI